MELYIDMKINSYERNKESNMVYKLRSHVSYIIISRGNEFLEKAVIILNFQKIFN